VLKRIIDQTTKDFPIDKDRIVLAGVSSGGSGCWEFANRYPELLAGVSPLAPGRFDRSRIDRLREVPVWAFISPDDPADVIEHNQLAARKVSMIGGECVLTLTDDATHDCWTTAFQDYDVLGWLLSVRRDGIRGRQIGDVPLAVRLAAFYRRIPGWQTSAPVAIVVALVTIIAIAIRKELTRRRIRIASN
jgi:pimeloyl-ACP methyl ester carboxylesterase